MATRQATLVRSSDLSQYVPYAVARSSDGLGWRGVRAEIVRGHEPGELALPGLDHHLLNLIVAGPTQHEHRWDGQAAECAAREGAASLVPAGCASYWRWRYLEAAPACDFHLHLEPGFVRRVATADLSTLPRSAEFRGELCFYDDAVRQIGVALMGELESGGLRGALFAESLAVALLRLQGAWREGVIGEARRLPVAAIGAVCAYIEEHLGERLHLEDLAAQMEMGPGRFTQIFRQSKGVSPYQYVLLRRMERAKAMLAKAETPLTEVALRLGFSDHAHFSTTFRRHTGLTPTQFRTQARR